MKLLLCAIVGLHLSVVASFCQDQILLIQGAPGQERFEEAFDRASTAWVELAKKSNIPLTHIKPGPVAPTMKQRIQTLLTDQNTQSTSELWIIYIGHGTSNDSGAKLNLEGPDISSDELANWLSPFEGQLVFVHGGSASAPFLPHLSGPNRIIVTATRSATEVNYARFGEYFAQAINDPRSDLDLDGSVSLLEAFVAASSAVETFYAESGRLTSEHALIDDNGDGRGYEASSFDGLRGKDEGQDGRLARRTTLRQSDAAPLLTADQIKTRNRLEAQLEELYSQKNDTPADAYYEELESILDQLAEIYRDADDS